MKGFEKLEDLGYALTDGDYDFQVSFERHDHSKNHYIVVTKNIKGEPDAILTVPLKYAGVIGSLLVQSYLKYECIDDKGKIPNTVKNIE